MQDSKDCEVYGHQDGRSLLRGRRTRRACTGIVCSTRFLSRGRLSIGAKPPQNDMSHFCEMQPTGPFPARGPNLLAFCDLMHMQLCDEAICVGPAASKDSYLNTDRIIDAMRITGAQVWAEAWLRVTHDTREMRTHAHVASCATNHSSFASLCTCIYALARRGSIEAQEITHMVAAFMQSRNFSLACVLLIPMRVPYLSVYFLGGSAISRRSKRKRESRCDVDQNQPFETIRSDSATDVCLCKRAHGLRPSFLCPPRMLFVHASYACLLSMQDLNLVR